MKKLRQFVVSLSLLFLNVGYVHADRNDLLESAYLAFHKGEYKKALDIYEQPDLSSRPDIQFLLAYMYMLGFGAKENEKESLSWLIMSVHQNHLQAVDHMESVYRYGLYGFEKDEDKRKYWEELTNQILDGLKK